MVKRLDARYITTEDVAVDDAATGDAVPGPRLAEGHGGQEGRRSAARGGGGR
jgi:hypothetical protein